MREPTALPLGTRERPRLTLRGIVALVTTYLVIGPTSAFGIGLPLGLLNDLALRALVGGVHGPQHLTVLEALETVLEACAAIVVGLPFYGPWADLSLWHVAAWIAAGVILVATSRRGLRIGDAALIAAAAVLVFPALVDHDGPHLTWSYPDAGYMALAAAGGAALCTAFVRGFGEGGVRKRIAWGWLA